MDQMRALGGDREATGTFPTLLRMYEDQLDVYRGIAEASAPWKVIGSAKDTMIM